MLLTSRVRLVSSAFLEALIRRDVSICQKRTYRRFNKMVLENVGSAGIERTINKLGWRPFYSHSNIHMESSNFSKFCISTNYLNRYTLNLTQS
jgi:deoxyribodipyrimidine photolyase